jgi:hypothetical protein
MSPSERPPSIRSHRGVQLEKDQTNQVGSTPSVGQQEEAPLNLATQSWRFMKTFGRLLSRLEATEQK